MNGDVENPIHEDFFASRLWLMAQVVIAMLLVIYAFGVARKFSLWLSAIFALFAATELLIVWRQWRTPLFSITAEALVVRDARLSFSKLREQQYWFKDCLFLEEKSLHGIVSLQCGEKCVPLLASVLTRSDRKRFIALLKARYKIST